MGSQDILVPEFPPSTGVMAKGMQSLNKSLGRKPEEITLILAQDFSPGREKKSLELAEKNNNEEERIKQKNYVEAKGKHHLIPDNDLKDMLSKKGSLNDALWNYYANGVAMKYIQDNYKKKLSIWLGFPSGVQFSASFSDMFKDLILAYFLRAGFHESTTGAVPTDSNSGVVVIESNYAFDHSEFIYCHPGWCVLSSVTSTVYNEWIQSVKDDFDWKSILKDPVEAKKIFDSRNIPADKSEWQSQIDKKIRSVLL